jgi:hypothetical protein
MHRLCYRRGLYIYPVSVMILDKVIYTDWRVDKGIAKIGKALGISYAEACVCPQPASVRGYRLTMVRLASSSRNNGQYLSSPVLSLPPRMRIWSWM